MTGFQQIGEEGVRGRKRGGQAEGEREEGIRREVLGVEEKRGGGGWCQRVGRRLCVCEEVQGFDACWGSLGWAVHAAASRPKALYKFDASDNLQLTPILDMTH
ncbi:hypothetical protein EYF80_014409 [Liparis tanakae]|uniref:Uncharacterized protein n=1 Tax=Liparis tanakae TaxID=230148 RepID=A0A4Z2IDH6_9TELE|nr:hypothetical protein EYF80_014409 [Liparis tanakae]